MRSTIHPSLYYCLIISYIATPSYAEDIIELGEITVMAEREKNISADQYSPIYQTTPYAHTDGADYLRSLSGISASRFGGHGSETFIRGQSQNQLNIIADDAYTFGGCPNRMDPPQRI